MHILGIDPGIGSTGFAILGESHSSRLTLVQSGEVRTNLKSPFQVRLKKIFDQLLQVIDETTPSAVAIEDTFLARNVKTALKLGQARGVALLAAAFRNLPVFEYSPTSVKLSVVGYGGASKVQVKEMVTRLLKIHSTITSEHAVDAAAVAICHAHTVAFDRRVHSSEKSASV
ncbi:MAG: crossover junction endodeoxyribonuclease RuvC [Nitrospiria bacterium]